MSSGYGHLCLRLIKTNYSVYTYCCVASRGGAHQDKWTPLLSLAWELLGMDATMTTVNKQSLWQPNMCGNMLNLFLHSFFISFKNPSPILTLKYLTLWPTCFICQKINKIFCCLEVSITKANIVYIGDTFNHRLLVQGPGHSLHWSKKKYIFS